MKTINQCQSPWGAMKLEPSNSTCCQIGCVTVGLCWLSDWYGRYVNPAKAIPQLSYTREGYLFWNSADKVFPFKFVYRYYKRDDKKIQEILNSKDGSCELQVNNKKHWVVALNYSKLKGYRVFDPLKGDTCWLTLRYGNGIQGFAEFTRDETPSVCEVDEIEQELKDCKKKNLDLLEDNMHLEERLKEINKLSK